MRILFISFFVTFLSFSTYGYQTDMNRNLLINAHTNFKEAAYSVVWCYEQLGDRMPLEFDEEGRCGNSNLASIWLNKSKNSNIKVMVYEYKYSRDVGVKYFSDMSGSVRFINKNNKKCSFNLAFGHGDAESYAALIATPALNTLNTEVPLLKVHCK